ncbi:hypothetical protein [Mycolicibacterium austroafricanum]|nr:hypothetical protein [Mycolicibacterium austroafricanum]QZT65873.1 hypothetical protein JN085_04810 [Mycolicibacterium austroafricanum]
MTETAKHAIVIGASLGGLCAARVLSNVYDRVTVYGRGWSGARSGTI